jgi:hypothetical protein
MERFYRQSIIITIFFQSVILFATTAVQATTDPIIRIKLSGTVYSDETIIRFKEGTTTAFDFDYDAYKIMSRRTTPSMYTYIGTTNYSINSIPSKDSLPTIQLGTKINENGIYTMSFENSDGLHNYILIDKKLGEEIFVDSSVVYSFTGSVSDAVDRFELQLQVADTSSSNINMVFSEEPAMPISKMVPEPSVSVVSCYGGILVSLEDVSVGMYKIEIVGMGGRVLETMTNSISSSGLTRDYIEVNNLTAGNYLVRLLCDNKVSTYHIVII